MFPIPLVHLPVVDMRESPSLKSRVMSQALFGEEIVVRKNADHWIYITTSDGYSGWVAEGSFILSHVSYYESQISSSRLKAHIYAEPDTEFGPLFSLPYGSRLRLIDASDARWAKILLPDGREAYIQKGDVEPEIFDLNKFSQKFIGLPYTWGGRSIFGYDCSGYVQMLYGKMGLRLPRDARQQIRDPRGRAVAIEDLALGDLIFWGDSAEDIRHVGMFLQKGAFIHTSARENRPYLRISQLTDPAWTGYREARRFW